MIKQVYKNKKDCCGCELCSQVCPTSIIQMEQDGEGFYYPRLVDSEKCIRCNLCETVCPQKHRIVAPREIRSVYAGFAKDIDEIRHSSSGGMATVISKSFIEHGGVVYGVQYTEDCRSIIYNRAQSVSDLDKFRGSKYAQPRKTGVFGSILKDLKNRNKVLFIGVPCDVAAVNNLAKNKYPNLFTLELICHGVTSLKVHQQFVDNDVSIAEKGLSAFSVRYKKDGWKPYYIYEKYEDGKIVIKPYSSTAYGTAFIYLKRPSCNSCKFKLFNKEYGLQADMTIGDNHGVKINSPAYNKWGSSVAFVHTNKGEQMIELIQEAFVLIPESSDLVRNNLALYKAFPKLSNRKSFSDTFVKKDIFKASGLISVKLIDVKDNVKVMIISNFIKFFNRFGLSKYKSQCYQILGLFFSKYRKVKIQKHS